MYEQETITIENLYTIEANGRSVRYADVIIKHEGRLEIRGSGSFCIDALTVEDSTKAQIIFINAKDNLPEAVWMSVNQIKGSVIAENKMNSESGINICYNTQDNGSIKLAETNSASRVRISRRDEEPLCTCIKPPQFETGGINQLDYSNPEHLKYIFASYGGEKNMKERYPLLYKSALLTRDSHAKNPPLPLNNSGNGMQEQFVASTPMSLKPVKKLSNDSMISTSSKFHVSNPEIKAVFLEGKMYYEKNDRVIKSFSKILERCDLDRVRGDDYLLQEYVKEVQQKQKTVIKAVTKMIIYYKDNTQKTVFSHQHSYTIIGSEDSIESMEITHPKAKDVNNKVIKIGYYYPPSDVDYKYSAGTDRKTVKIQFPIKGKIKIKAGCTLKEDYLVFDNESQRPLLEYNSDGIATYERSDKEIKAFFKKADDRTVEFDYNVDWQKEVDLSVYLKDSGALLKFYLTLHFNVNSAGISYDIYAYVMSKGILSEERKYYSSVNEPDVYVPNIQIIWDCFAADTQITMPDNSVKTISQIKTGDMVKGADGKVYRVNGVIAGDEPDSLTQIKTSGNHSISVSKYHTLPVKNGYKNASDIKTGDELALPGGKFTTVTSIKENAEMSKVFNIDTGGKGNLIIANGLVSPDAIFMSNQPMPLSGKRYTGINTENETDNALRRELYLVAADRAAMF